MKLYIGKEAGFCWGVKRAVNLTQKAIENNSQVYTYGPLIHNPQVVENLSKKGVRIVEAPETLTEGALVIRAHGIPPQKLEQVKVNEKLKIVDGTCPHVTKSEKKVNEASQKGYYIIIVGDPNHAEVKTLQGFAKNYSIVTNLEDAKNLKLHCNKIFIIAQSTYSAEIYYQIVEYFISKKEIQVDFYDSICSEPLKTQNELYEICKIVQCVIVIGGRNSANTKRLEEIALQAGKKVIRIETAQELQINELAQFQNIGLTAGASTPDWIINEVVEKIKNEIPNVEIVEFENNN